MQFSGLWVLDLRRVAGTDEDFTLVLTEAIDAILVYLQLQTSLNAVQDAFSELDLFLVDQILGGWEADWLSSQLRWVALVVKLNEWRTQASFQNFFSSVVYRDLQVTESWKVPLLHCSVGLLVWGRCVILHALTI